ncbi:S8/S53 family peptidase [Chitinophaga sedimenti]|uniref:S8/S53 family peptidase n=1 Tax=Chitinophaga sedimenti TaxID=2033606 RepID=UPI00249DA9E0|nr:S8/S53 family peptidase [Chitinophaga sedimenti]
MEGVETGETLKGINEWLYKTNDKGEKQYYWRGGSGDTEAVFQWGIQALGVDQVWARGIKGEKVKVAIIDTGIDLNNPFLSHAVVDGFNVLTGQNYASNPLCIQDTYGHGSSCASILAGSHQGMHPGIAPACELIVIKVADDEDDRMLKKIYLQPLIRPRHLGPK